MAQFISPQLTACFRQWRAEGTHCRFTHAYKVWFELDFDQDINVVFNLYPELKQSLIEWFLSNFNYKTFVSENDPELDTFKLLDQNNAISLVTIPEVGCERFSEYVLDNVNVILSQFDLDIKCVRVETWEHEKNSGVAYI
jgi:6-pyruvoyltetrahydropterin/6-carboxytetrahydropterin synthase